MAKKEEKKDEVTEKWKFYALAGLILVILVGAGVLSYEIKKSNPSTDPAAADAADMQSQVAALNKKIDDLNKAIEQAKSTTSTTTTTSVKTSSSSASSSSAATVSGKVNINTADEAALDSLPQVGPVTAQAIIDYRNANGPFKSIDELDNVKGIGPATIAKFRDLVTI